jgi:hypothetical protein
MVRHLVMLLAMVVVSVGCQSKPPPVVKAPPADEAKATLQRAANDGNVGSDVLALKTYFEDLQKTDPAKGGALLKDLDSLIQSGTQAGGMGSEQVKQKAKALLGKL